MSSDHFPLQNGALRILSLLAALFYEDSAWPHILFCPHLLVHDTLLTVNLKYIDDALACGTVPH